MNMPSSIQDINIFYTQYRAYVNIVQMWHISMAYQIWDMFWYISFLYIYINRSEGVTGAYLLSLYGKYQVTFSEGYKNAHH